MFNSITTPLYAHYIGKLQHKGVDVFDIYNAWLHLVLLPDTVLYVIIYLAHASFKCFLYGNINIV